MAIIVPLSSPLTISRRDSGLWFDGTRSVRFFALCAGRPDASLFLFFEKHLRASLEDKSWPRQVLRRSGRASLAWEKGSVGSVCPPERESRPRRLCICSLFFSGAL